MTLVLPGGQEVKTYGAGIPGAVFIGGVEIPLGDFLQAAEYVLTNTDLQPGDPRADFVAKVKSATEVAGYNPGGKKISLPGST